MWGEAPPVRHRTLWCSCPLLADKVSLLPVALGLLGLGVQQRPAEVLGVAPRPRVRPRGDSVQFRITEKVRGRPVSGALGQPELEPAHCLRVASVSEDRKSMLNRVKCFFCKY